MDKTCEMLRSKIVDIEKRAVKVTNFAGLEESLDNNCYVNCKGLGRIRKYKNFNLFLDNMQATEKRLLRGVDPTLQEFQTQVFQLVGCNMRCWYCFVDDCILAANNNNSEWLLVSEMVDSFVKENDNPLIIDLSGGQPDLVPEWCYWVMEEIEKRNLKNKVYVWIDDNLTTMEVMEECLTSDQISYMAQFPKHSRACCFKGYNDETYSFNVRTKYKSLKEQIYSFRKLYSYGFDIYAYISLTGPKGSANERDIELFINEIQSIHPMLPLRIIPLKIKEFEVTSGRMNKVYEEAMQEQYKAYIIWKRIIERRYTKKEIKLPYEAINIHD